MKPGDEVEVFHFPHEEDFGDGFMYEGTLKDKHPAQPAGQWIRMTDGSLIEFWVVENPVGVRVLHMIRVMPGGTPAKRPETQTEKEGG